MPPKSAKPSLQVIMTSRVSSTLLEKRIEQATGINHSDQELILLEKLVSRIPPFVKLNRNDGGKFSKSDNPYSSIKYGY